ncbi:entericidin EcnAB [Brucella pinnipedialis B2/94]|nr:entericidin EcnAB [Brucella pinnipedialis B2/94]
MPAKNTTPNIGISRRIRLPLLLAKISFGKMAGIEWLGNWSAWPSRVQRAYPMGETEMKLTRLVPIALVLCAFTLASCANTVRGVGRDVKSTAHAVQETVE